MGEAVNLYRRLQVRFRLELLRHYIAAAGSVNRAAHALGMDAADFRKTLARVKRQNQRNP